MNTYKYSALSPDGAKVNGVVDAVDEYAAVRRIKTDCPVVLSISEVKEQAGVVKFLNADIGGKKVDLKSLSVMCSQFHIIMGSGVPVDAAIRMIAQQTVDKNLRRMLEKSADDVSQGTPMSVAFSKNYPQLPTLFIETVRAGEISGTIDRSFGTLEKYYEKTYKLQQKVKAALSYPIFVLGVAIVVLIVVMGFVMPRPLANPRTKVVFPAPTSPINSKTKACEQSVLGPLRSRPSLRGSLANLLPLSQTTSN